MPAPSLLLSGLLGVTTSAACVAVGFLVARPARRSQAWLVSTSFPAFWHSAGVVTGSQGLRALAAAFGVDSFPLIVALEGVTTPFYCLGAASLLFYVLYLLTGRTTWAIPVALYYLALLPVLRYYVALAHPIGYEVTEWQVNYVYEHPIHRPGYVLALGLVMAPVLAAVAAYGSLAWRVHDAASRYRIACVASGLGLWVLVEGLAFASGFAATDAGELTRRAVGLLATGVTAMGYLPPAYARRRWGARSEADPDLDGARRADAA